MTAGAPRSWGRREVLRTLAGGSLAGALPPFLRPTQAGTMRTRPIPSTGEEIPVVGLGTWQTFDVGPSSEEREPLRRVLRLLVERGGSVVDSSPMYGRSESVVGELARDLGLIDDLFLATKVWTEGRREGTRQMEESFRRMRTRTMDLMQVHNLVDVSTHLDTLRAWKEEGRIRYVGVTHYRVAAFGRLEELIRTRDLDFVQLNFSMGARAAENRLLPLAGDHGVAVLVNRPYRGGSLFRRVRGRELPAWAREFDCGSWGQFFLKYVLSEPHVTCVIPGTSDPAHLVDNTGAGYGRLPDPPTRRRMVEHLQSL